MMTNTTKSWRDVLPIHPAAEKFPMMSPDELRALGEDIKANGLRTPAVLQLDANGEPVLLDGRNRLDALALIGEKITLDNSMIFEAIPTDIDPDAYVISVNIRRRHLTPEKREQLLIEIIARTPKKSDRQIGREMGFDHKTISRARAKGEARGALPHVETHTDTKGRQQPARKPPRERKPTPIERSLKRLKQSGTVLALGGDPSKAQQATADDAAKAEANKRETLLRLTEAAWRGVSAWASSDFADEMRVRLDDASFRRSLRDRLRISADLDHIDDIARGATALANVLRSFFEAPAAAPQPTNGAAEDDPLAIPGFLRRSAP
jgi:hypothetical protein